MPLTDQIRGDMREAMRSGDAQRRDALRLLISALNNARIELGHEPDDAEAARVLQREAKQRRDSIAEYERAGRDDLVRKEQAELAVIEEFLPEQMSDDDIRQAVRRQIEASGAAGPGDMGKVMGPLMQQLAGRADGRRVNEIVREELAAS